MIGEPAKNVHGVGIGTLSKILAVKWISVPITFMKIHTTWLLQGGGGHVPPPSFFQISYITLSQLGGHIIPNQYYVPPGFSDLATALYYTLKNSCSE